MSTKAAKKRKRTKQDESEDKELLLDARRQHAEFEHFLNNVLECPVLWGHRDTGYLRDFVDKVSHNPGRYPPQIGDKGSLQPDRNGHSGLTRGFVHSCSVGGDPNDGGCPTLQVVIKDSKHKDGYRKDPRRKFIDITLMDGDDNTILARLATHCVDFGRFLQLGDVIQLDLYNDLTYQLNADSPNMPWLLILNYTIVGKDPLPSKKCLKDPIPMAPSAFASATSMPSPAVDTAQFSSAATSNANDDSEEECTEHNRLCSIYGTKFKVCVCECIPVEQVVLAEIAQDCYFADDVEKMEPNHKRNLLYWYYATNVYLICGAHNRKELPACLVSRIRELYPSPDGTVVGYKDMDHYVQY
jgi:hypothetical protein